MSNPETPDVSVLIPAYNRAEYLQSSIDSILSQQWNGTLEIVCVDDGSERDPFAKLSGSLPPSVRLIRKEHGGLGSTRKFALEQARGRYIAFNDDDDLWLPNSLAMRMEILEKHPDIDMVFTDLREFTDAGDDPETRNAGRRDFVTAPRTRVEGWDPPLYRYGKDSLVPAFMAGAPLFFQTILVRREFLHRIGGMDARTSCAENIDLGLRASHGGVIGYLDTVTFRLRRGHSHMTATDDWLDKEMREFFVIYPSYPPALQKLLQPHLARFLSNKGWMHFLRHEYPESARAYRHAARHGDIGARARVKWAIAWMLSIAS